MDCDVKVLAEKSPLKCMISMIPKKKRKMPGDVSSKKKNVSPCHEFNKHNNKPVLEMISKFMVHLHKGASKCLFARDRLI